MKPNLLEIDKAFTEQYSSLFEIQQKIQTQLSDYEFDLSKTEITDAIINRMDAFWYFNVRNNKELLGRVINTTAADFFTETCLFFIKSYFEQNPEIEVKSESKITQVNGIRPDITIWKNKLLIAVIELKVSNGWKGKFILPHLEEREKIIKAHHPNIYFGVLAFWNFFDTKNENWNTKYFGLRNIEKNNHFRTDASVEAMIRMVNEVI